MLSEGLASIQNIRCMQFDKSEHVHKPMIHHYYNNLTLIEPTIFLVHLYIIS